MAKLIPKSVAPEQWKALTPQKAFGFRINADDSIYLRLGAGGVYLSIENSPPVGKSVNSITVEEGAPTALGKIKEAEITALGRGSDCTIKIIHPVMSRHHLELRLDGNVLVIKDLGSTNGTFFYSENVAFDI